jgi:holin-like protein
MPALTGLAWLLLCQSAGEALVRLLQLRLPGPVVGMLLLLGLLRWPAVRRCGACATPCWPTCRCCSCRWAWA